MEPEHQKLYFSVNININGRTKVKNLVGVNYSKTISQIIYDPVNGFTVVNRRLLKVTVGLVKGSTWSLPFMFGQGFMNTYENAELLHVS